MPCFVKLVHKAYNYQVRNSLGKTCTSTCARHTGNRANTSGLFVTASSRSFTCQLARYGSRLLGSFWKAVLTVRKQENTQMNIIIIIIIIVIVAVIIIVITTIIIVIVIIINGCFSDIGDHQMNMNTSNSRNDHKNWHRRAHRTLTIF